MLIAREKRQTNIAEYILYMWQVEDLIRANQLDIDRIEQSIINGFDESDAVKEEMREWYAGLIAEMIQEGIERTGHRKETLEFIDELNLVHRSLLNVTRDSFYRNLFQQAFPIIGEFQQKSRTWEDEITTCFNGLYSQLLLRLKRVEVSPETQQAFMLFGGVVAYLAQNWHKDNPQPVENE